MNLLEPFRRGAPLTLAAALLVLAACAGRDDAPQPVDDTPLAGIPQPGRESSETDAGKNATPDEAGQASQAPGVEEIVLSSRVRREHLAHDSSLGMVAPASPTVLGQSLEQLRQASERLDRENYASIDPNPLRLVSEHPVSTFSIDVDTGAYANVRRMLNEGRLPPADAVRVEELINYFNYRYPVPESTDTPFSVNTTLARAPWNADRLLLQVGIKGYEVPAENRPPANLVFLVDVSGSMHSPQKLPLLKNAMKLLTRQMRADDRVSLVVYAGAAGVVLEPTPGDQQAKILAALEQLTAGGSTNGAGGIRAAYRMARQAYIAGGINRVMLATDGDFNVGTVDFDSLVGLVEREREGGVSLTTLGFGAGNYNDQLMEQLADAGNGNHAYIDNLNEARKVLVEQVGATLQTIAKDVKIQVEFNPAVVAEYRLIGYENRMLRREDFNNDKIDAGEIGAGHTVTALYELALVGSPGRLVDPLRYGREPAGGRGVEPATAIRQPNPEAAYVRLRYKAPGGDTSRLIETPVRVDDTRGSEELRFAAAVAAFGQLLRGGEYLGDYAYSDVLALASGNRGPDPHGYRGEFLGLVRLADSLATVSPPAPQARR